MAARIVSSQVVASVKRTGARFQSTTAQNSSFLAEREAVKKHAAGNLIIYSLIFKQYSFYP